LQKDRQGKSTVQHLELILVMTPSFFLFLASRYEAYDMSNRTPSLRNQSLND
jgi:hypothetical protein